MSRYFIRDNANTYIFFVRQTQMLFWCHVAKHCSACSINISRKISHVRSSALPTLRFSIHPSMQLLSFHYNSFTVWKALSDEQEPPEARHLNTPETWLIWRDSQLITRYCPVLETETTALSLARHGNLFPDIPRLYSITLTKKKYL